LDPRTRLFLDHHQRAAAGECGHGDNHVMIPTGDPVTRPLRILHLEDNATDGELVRALLEEEGIACSILRVETRDEFDTALRRERFDLIISDFTLPSFDGLSALALARTECPDTAFIFVSGTIGEE